MKKILVALLILSCSTALFAQEQVSVGGITFYLADGFSIRGRSSLNDGEVLQIAPDPNPDNNRMVIKVLPNALEGIDGLTSEEVSDMLSDAVDKLAHVIADTEDSGYTLDRDYRIRFEDDPRVPVAYTDFGGKDQKGRPFLLHAESALTDGFLITCCAIANNKSNLDELVYIYQEVMAGERDVPQGMPTTRPVTVKGITFDLDEDFYIYDNASSDDGDTILILPNDIDTDTDLLTLLLLPDILPNAKSLAAGKVEELLRNSTEKLAKAVAQNFTVPKSYNIVYDDDERSPNAFTNFDGKNKSGTPFSCHVETALVNGTIIGCCALGSNQDMLSRLIRIYYSALSAAE